MELMVLHVADCPHVELLRDRLGAALDRLGVTAPVVERLVRDIDDGTARGFHGSPTVLIDGHDPVGTGGDCGLACRLYSTADGVQGAPSVDQFVEALRR